MAPLLAELGSDPLFERATALAFRQAVDPRFLREATVEQLAAHVVREAWLTGPHLSKPTVANVEYYEDYAVARVTYPEGSASYLRLVQEAGFWKIDLRPTLRQSNDAAARLGRNGDVVVLNLVEQMTGSRPGDDIWEPPLAGHPYCAE